MSYSSNTALIWHGIPYIIRGLSEVEKKKYLLAIAQSKNSD